MSSASATAPIDLRSDTVTQPDAEMRGAILAAEVGDDSYGGDPTVGRLEARIAQILGKESALFLPSGTMANQIAVQLHAGRGECIVGAPESHVEIHEDGSAARLGGVDFMPLGSRVGFSGPELEFRLQQDACGWPRAGLIWLENTRGAAGGRVLPIASQDELCALAQRWQRPVHLDGARLWNASVALDESPERLCRGVDTVSVCLSKGLGAPFGSLLAGSSVLIARAKELRHSMGGGLRQSGLMAAAGLHALDRGWHHLAQDHRRALRLWEALRGLPGVEGDAPQTNIVLLRVAHPTALKLAQQLEAGGVRCFANRSDEVRLVTHRDLDDSAIDVAIERVKAVWAARSS